MKIDHNGFLPGCKGIFLGGCVERGEGSSFHAQAHAHQDKKDGYFGWICVRGKRRMPTLIMNNPIGKPEEGSPFEWFEASLMNTNQLLMHEYCHILTGHGHDEVWRRKMRELGQPIRKQYQKKKRPEVSRWVTVSLGEV